MAMAMTVQGYLRDSDASYEVLSHPHSASSMETAMAAGIPADRLVKSVVLGDNMGGYMMAVLPASYQVGVGRLRLYYGRDLHLASERETETLFADCERGAIPALGQAYGMKTVIEEDLAQQPEVYFEAGDHEALVHMRTDTFLAMMRGADHTRFGRRMMADA